MKFTDVFATEAHRIRIYVVSDNSNVVYVGLAKNSSVGERLAKHMENSVCSKKKSMFAKLLLEKHPRYFEWGVSIYTLQECTNLTNTPVTCLEQAERAVYDYYKCLQGRPPIGNGMRPSGKPKVARRSSTSMVVTAWEHGG